MTRNVRNSASPPPDNFACFSRCAKVPSRFTAAKATKLSNVVGSLWAVCPKTSLISIRAQVQYIPSFPCSKKTAQLHLHGPCMARLSRLVKKIFLCLWKMWKKAKFGTKSTIFSNRTTFSKQNKLYNNWIKIKKKIPGNYGWGSSPLTSVEEPPLRQNKFETSTVWLPFGEER